MITLCFEDSSLFPEFNVLHFWLPLKPALPHKTSAWIQCNNILGLCCIFKNSLDNLVLKYVIKAWIINTLEKKLMATFCNVYTINNQNHLCVAEKRLRKFPEKSLLSGAISCSEIIPLKEVGVL